MSNLETFARDELQRAGLPEPMECPECIRYERERHVVVPASDADEMIDMLNVVCDDFGCEPGSNRLHWLHEQLSELARLRSAAPPVQMEAQFFDLGNGDAICCNPGGRMHGWLLRRHPDGQLVSVRKLDEAEPYPADSLFAKLGGRS